MSFLIPIGFALFGLAVPLVALYFIRARRRERRVASLLLWPETPRERTASPLFQRIAWDPLILLQLAALAALAAALARPAVTVMGEAQRRVVVVLDTSVSMKATDVRPSRFEAAREKAEAMVRGLREGVEVMVIASDIEPRVVQPFTRERSKAVDSIEGTKARDLPDRLAPAIETARALVGSDERAEIHVFTDGAFAERPAAGDSRVRWVGVAPAGGGRGNVGITQLSVRRAPQAGAGYEAFVSFANFSARPRTFNVSLKVDSRTVTDREVTLGAGLRRSLVLPFRHTGAARVAAQLQVEDDLESDNTALALLPAPKKFAVLLVSPGNLFLEKALRTDPDVALEVRTPDKYQGGMGNADVVVLDSATPQAVGPGRFIFVNTVPPDVPVDLLGTTETPGVVDWDRSHPVMRHVELSRIALQSAMRLRPLAPGRALVDSLSGPLVFALDEPGRKALVMGFDLFKADLPLRVAFPLMMSNALRWLHPGGLEHQSLQAAAGEPLSIPVPHGVDAVDVNTPSGKRLPGRLANGVASFADTGEIGVYTVGTGKGDVQVAVNLANAEESSIAPQPLPASPPSVEPAPAPMPYEVWWIFAGLALALLVIEGALWWRRQAAAARVGRGQTFAMPSDPGDRAALVVRGVLLAVLAAALLRPTLPQFIDRMNVVYLVDLSESIAPDSRRRMLDFLGAAARERGAEDRYGVIAFGADAAIETPLGAHDAKLLDTPQARTDARGSNLDRAVQLALAMLPPGQANRIILATDGRQTAGDAVAAAQGAREAGADLHLLAAPFTASQEVIAEQLQLPREVKFGEPFEARLVAFSHKAGEGRVALFRNGEFVGSQRVKLAAGKNVFSYRQALDRDGIHVYQAVIEVAGDVIETNNRAVGTVLVRGRPQVLIADRDRTHAQGLAAALRAQQLEVTVVEPGGIPTDPAALEKYDGIVLSNVPATRLKPAQMAMIRDYVRDSGGGLIMLGGDQSFGLGGYFKTPIEEALPVTMEVKQRVDVPNLSIVLSIDRSDSMTTVASGKVTFLDLAKEAAHLVVDLVDEQSEIGVMSWDTEWKWDVPVRNARDKQAIHRGIASIVSGGGTDGFPALREAHRALASRPALLKHVIFLTDGHMRREQFQSLVEQMAREQITVSSVAVGKYADERLLANIARWGKGRYYVTEDSSSLPRIFAVETQLAQNSTLIEQPFKPKLTDPGHEAAQDIDWRGVPPLAGYVATSPKANVDQVLRSQWDDPVLATWRYGLGRTAAFTSDATSRWAGQWLQWRDFNKFWAQLVRWTLRSGSVGETTATVQRRGAQGEVIVEAVDGRGNFVNFLDAQVGIIAPDKSRSVIELEQVAPGRYLGRFPAAQEGVYLVGVTPRAGPQAGAAARGSQVTGLVVPYAEELRELGTDETMLKRLGEAGGGSLLEAPRDVFQKARRRFRAAVELWPWLAGIAAVLLLAEIALRRFGGGIAARLFARLRRRS